MIRGVDNYYIRRVNLACNGIARGLAGAPPGRGYIVLKA